MRVNDLGDGDAVFHDLNIRDGLAAQIRLFGSGAPPGGAQVAFRQKRHIAVRHKVMNLLAFIGVLLVIHDDASQSGGVLENGGDVPVRQITHAHAVCGQEAVLHGSHTAQQAEGVCVHGGVADLSALGRNGVLGGLNVREGIGGVASRPERGACQRKIIGGLPRAVRVVIVGVVNAVRLDGNAHVAILGKKQLHDHPLRHHQSAVDQVAGVIENPANDFAGVGVIRIHNAHNLLPVFFLDFEAFTEERHFSLRDRHAGPVAVGRLRVKGGGHQGNRHAPVALEPFQVKPRLLPGGEKRLAQIGFAVAYSLRPVHRNSEGADLFTKIVKIHRALSPFVGFMGAHSGHCTYRNMCPHATRTSV